MDNRAVTAIAAIRSALPVLWHGEVDELEDVAGLVMDLRVKVPHEHHADIQAYLAGLWSLEVIARGEAAVDEPSKALIQDEVEGALARLRARGVEDLALAVRDEVFRDGAWQL